MIKPFDQYLPLYYNLFYDLAVSIPSSERAIQIFFYI